MERVIAIMLAFLLVLPFAGINGSEVASTIDTNDILHVGGSGPGNYTSVQAAIDDAGDGAIVYVYPGTYEERVIVNRSLSLLGVVEDGERPVIDGGGRDHAVDIFGDGCRFANLTISNLGAGYRYVTVYMSSNRTVFEHVWIETDGTSFVMDWWHSSDNVVTNCTVTGGGFMGWTLQDCHQNLIADNNLSGNPGGAGIAFSYCDNNTIRNNRICNNFHGFTVLNSNHNIVSNNVIRNTTQSGLGFVGNGNVATNNIISSSGINGIKITRSAYNRIENNTVTHNGLRGITLSGSGRCHNNLLKRNMIAHNHEGIYLEWMCDHNTIEENDFISNGNQAHFYLINHSCRNTWRGNYWSDHPSSFPRLIPGHIERPFFYHRWWRVDWSPAPEPHGNITST